MGKILQIRVIATTYRAEEVKEAWPRLSALAWPHPPRVAGPPPEARGVLELAGVLHDRARFVHKDGALAPELMQGLADAAQKRRDIEAALADWAPERANTLSQELESLLDELEGLAPDVPFVVSKPDAVQGARGALPEEGGGAKSAAAGAASGRIRNFFRALIGRR
jgi:hypothetical protein